MERSDQTGGNKTYQVYPGTDQGQAGTNQGQPGTDQRQPGTDQRQTGTEHGQPGTSGIIGKIPNAPQGLQSL